MKVNYVYLCLLTIAISYISSTSLYAQPGALDTTFNGSGELIQDIAGKNDYAFATAIQPDGKILTAGIAFIDTIDYNDFILVRYKPNGQLDSSFGTNGMTHIGFSNGSDDQAMSMCLQPDGKIIVAGKTFPLGNAADFAVARYNPDGTLDNTFGSGGKVTTDVAGFNDYGACVKLQSDGKIVMTGYTFNGTGTGLAVVRYNSNGTLDNSFNGNGIAVIQRGDVYLEGQSLAVQSDGKIVACATTKLPLNEYDILVIRLNANGSADSTFDNDGIVTTDFCYHDNAYSVAIQNDGKIVVGGTSYDTVNVTMGKNVMLIRYKSNGSVDSSFGRNGKVITNVTSQTDIAYAVTIQSNGKILTVGQSTDGVANFSIILTRHHSDGSLDSSFGYNGLVITNMAYMHEFGEAVALQADGKIVVAGFVNNDSNFNMFVARYIGDTPIVNSADNIPKGKLLVYPNPSSGTVFIESPVEWNGAVITLTNMKGQLVQEVKNVRGRTYALHCQNISDGIYILCISQNGLLADRQMIRILQN